MRWWVILVGASALFGQTGRHDPAFEKVPFREWLTENQRSPFHWTTQIPQPQLSFHQRLMAHFTADIDGTDLAIRRGKGELVIFAQITDEQGRVYQNHGALGLEKVEAGIKASRYLYTQTAFILPGTYEVDMALYDSATGEHAVRKEKLRVAPLRRDPWPDAWRELPPVEFVDIGEGPDRWFLPEVRGRLQVTVNVKQQTAVEVMVNVSPSEDRSSGSVQENTRRMLLPTLKVISQIQLRPASLSISFIDLARRHVALRQENVRELDWPRVRDALAETDAGTIDVRALAHQGEESAFLEKQVSQRMERAEGPCAVVILSGVMAFAPGEEVAPPLGKRGACRVFYVRFQVPVLRQLVGRPNMGRHRGWDPRTAPVTATGARADQLESTLKGFGPRVFDVDTADEARMAMSEIFEEISHL